MKFDKTFCSQCGREFGPGDHGYSDCRSHGDRREELNATVEKWIEAQMITPLAALMQFGNQTARNTVDAEMARAFAITSPKGIVSALQDQFIATRTMHAVIKLCVVRHAWSMPYEIMKEYDKMRESEAFRALESHE